MADQGDLIRFARDAQGQVVQDPERRLFGRGAYLHPAAGCAEAARRRRSLERALKGSLDEAWVESVVRT